MNKPLYGYMNENPESIVDNTWKQTYSSPPVYKNTHGTYINNVILSVLINWVMDTYEFCPHSKHGMLLMEHQNYEFLAFFYCAALIRKQHHWILKIIPQPNTYYSQKTYRVNYLITSCVWAIFHKNNNTYITCFSDASLYFITTKVYLSHIHNRERERKRERHTHILYYI